ncbi:MAG TPA: glycosyltransferase [Myxococcales bacterium]|nr:glycosyltransferase [Myxococcales bacterium]
MPVLQIVNQFAIGGAEGQFVARVRRHPRGFRPVVACIQKKGPNLAAIEELGIPVEEFGLRGSLARLNTGHQILRLAAFMGREGVRLVHANDFYANLLAVPAARLTGAKIIASRFDLGHWYTRAHHVLEALASRSADAVYTNAEAVRDMCVGQEGIPADRVVVVHNGIDLEEFDRARRAPLSSPVPGLETGPDGRSRRPAIAVAANLYAVKGHLDLIEAVEIVRRTVPDVLVLCAGEGPMRPVLEQQIRARGLRDNVVLLGHRLDVPAILRRVHMGCLCSHAEGLSNAVIESMAASLPVVATAVGGNVELVTEAGSRASGHLVPPHKPAVLADRLLGLLRDPARSSALGAAGRARIEADLTLDAMIEKTGALYEQVLSSARSAKRLRAA